MTSRSLFEALQPSRPTSIVDIGASRVDGAPPYQEMLDLAICTVVGFEPQSKALAELDRRKSANERYLGHAIGDGAEHTLRVAAASGMTSLLEPDPETLRLFTDFEQFGKVMREEKLQTRRLDDVDEIAHLDLLKIDIQGGELGAIRCAAAKLAAAVAIQVEVSFVPLYKMQPVFGEIDLHLRGMGFLPHCFVEQKTWPLAPFRTLEARQLLEADVLYVRDFRSPSSMTGEQWKHLALIAHHCYRSHDLAMLAIRNASVLGATSPATTQFYSQLLGSVKKKRR